VDELDPIRDIVEREISRCSLARLLVGINGDDAIRSQRCRGDPENCGPCPDVEHPGAHIASPLVQESLERLEAHAGRGVVAGPEAHPGIDPD
jgi:hypothetical protein